MQNDHSDNDPANEDTKTSLAYSIAEACAVSGIRRTTLYKEINSGGLRAVKIGGRTVILLDDLRRWLDGRNSIIPEPSQSGP
jgi:excisionase family DNA binding protein